MSTVGIDIKHTPVIGGAKTQQSDAQNASRADDIVIGPGVRTAGKFETAGSIIVDGALDDGDVACRWFSISRGGEFQGAVSAERIEIAGLLEGEAVASEEIILRSSARVTGNITAPYVIIHRGAQLSGGVESTERTADNRKQAPMQLPLPRARQRRSLGIFVGTALVGVLLAGGAYALWGGKAPKEGEPVATLSST